MELTLDPDTQDENVWSYKTVEEEVFTSKVAITQTVRTQSRERLACGIILFLLMYYCAA